MKVWAWAPQAISPSKVRMWEEEVMVQPSPHTCPWCIPSPGDPPHSRSCWWVKPAPSTGKTHRISPGRVGRGVGQCSRRSATSINKAAAARCRTSCFSQLPKVPRTKDKKKKNQGNSSPGGFIPRRLGSAKVNGFLRRPTLLTLNHSLKQWDVELLSVVQDVGRRDPQGYQQNSTQLMERQHFWHFGFFGGNGTLCMHVEMFVNPPPQPLHVGCQASPPSLELGDGNVSCLQIRSDRLDTANLSLHVETRQKTKPEKREPIRSKMLPDREQISWRVDEKLGALAPNTKSGSFEASMSWPDQRTHLFHTSLIWLSSVSYIKVPAS